MITVSATVEVPASAGEIESWAQDEATRWSSSTMTAHINDAQAATNSIRGQAVTEFSEYMDQTAGVAGIPMGEAEIVAWGVSYAREPGLPSTPAEGLDMARAFITSQGQAVGIPPQYIAAYEAIEDFPDTIEEGEAWVANMSIDYAAYYGIPLGEAAEGEILQASVYAALSYIGVPYAIIDVSYDSLVDGNLSYDEASAIATTVGAYIGGVIGQAYGVPYPIGAFIGGVVVGGIMAGLGAAFGWSDDNWREEYHARQRALDQAAARATVEGTEVALALWHRYNYFWDDLETSLQSVIDAHTDPWLMVATDSGDTGLRYFRNTRIQTLEGTQLPDPINRNCQKIFGCAYWRPQHAQEPREPSAWARTNSCCPYDADTTPTLVRVSGYAGAVRNGRVDAQSALAFWGARRYVTPQSVYYDMWGVTSGATGARIIPITHAHASMSIDQFDRGTGLDHYFGESEYAGGGYLARQHTDRVFLGDVIAAVRSSGSSLSSSSLADWAEKLFASTTQAIPAAALIQRDITATIAARIAQTRVTAELEQQSIQQAAAKAAAYRKELIRIRRMGERKTDLFNNTLLVAGAGAFGGWAAATLRQR